MDLIKYFSHKTIYQKVGVDYIHTDSDNEVNPITEPNSFPSEIS